MAAEAPPPKKKLPWTRRFLSARGRSLEITKLGWLFILLTIAVGFAAINSGSNLLHVVFGVQLGIIVASGVLSEQMVQRAKVKRRLTSPLYAQGRGALAVELKNANPRIPMLAVSVEDDDRVDQRGATAPVFALSVGSGGTAQLHSTISMPRRGRFRLPRAVVATRFPFGLFVKRRELPDEGEVLVYPKIHRVDANAVGPSRAGEGESRGRRARDGEFFGLEEAREGAELRRLHWPATARLGRPIVREFEARGERERVLEVEDGVAGSEAFESHVEEVASLAVALLREGEIATGLSHRGEVVVEPALGPAQERRILEFLALVGERPESLKEAS